MLLYLLIMITGYQVIQVLLNMIKDRKKREEDLEEWKRFNK